MSFRTVVISKRGKLDLKMNYLVVRHESEVRRIFLDEINTVIIENPACSVTACLLGELSKRKIKVIFCDEKHSPSSELVPCHGHFESSGKLREQIGWDPEICRQIWTDIVGQKIKNQADFLSDKGQTDAAALLRTYVNQLQSGDTTNREGHAAKVYFGVIFGKDFRRGDGGAVDTALNYGYSIILSAFNREVVASGYFTQLGFAHHNNFNHFNLSCDLMEPFRIFIDRHVDNCHFRQFTTNEKHQVLEIFNLPFLIDSTVRRLDDCIRLYTGSVFKAIASKNTALIKYCSWQNPAQQSKSKSKQQGSL